ncbi:hypothetical protein EK21DRAFT_91112 [Setomelanomma holmii]|uniref:Uncharacterized protein n=1 Tax=Setomelanomma holmii TaxID=210430 RepID=A0A9P4LLD4_9PLEO|nr:hypothetical protein EK21DRAFT_91112 [Setomelanomma holmii]
MDKHRGGSVELHKCGSGVNKVRYAPEVYVGGAKLLLDFFYRHSTIDITTYVIGSISIAQNISLDHASVSGYPFCSRSHRRGASFQSSRDASQMQQEYASELKFEGAWLGAAFPDAEETLGNFADNYAAFHTRLRNLMIGLAKVHQDARSILVDAIRTACPQVGSIDWESAKSVMFDTTKVNGTCLKDAAKQALQNCTVLNILDDDISLGLHNCKTGMPIMIRRAEKDQLSRTQKSKDLVDTSGKQGAQTHVYIHKKPVGLPWKTSDDAHVNEGVDSAFSMTNWLYTAFGGPLSPDVASLRLET